MKRLTFPRTAGTHTRQAHAGLPEGTFEREFGADGFYGPATHLLHAHAPTGWSDWQGPLRPRAFDLARLPGQQSPAHAAILLGNAAVKIRSWSGSAPMDHLIRNADGDEILFVHRGTAAFFCDFGHLALAEGDYVLIPRGTMWRLDPAPGFMMLMIEATNGAVGLPERGMLGAFAPFDAAIFDVPALDAAFEAQKSENPWRVLIRRAETLSTVTYPYNPLDTLGWHGDLLPVRLNWHDIRPLASHRVHLPPSVHTTFAADRFVVCTFVPRPLETDPDALKLPFFHSNNDYDEVLFYHAGDFISRDNIRAGMMTLHPAGFPHGPHPKAFQAAARGTRSQTDEVAVMVDTRDPLEIGPALADVEWAGYVESWTS